VALFFATGGLGVMQKIHQQSAYANQRQTFLLVAFAVSTVLSLLLYIALLIKNKNNVTLQKEKEPNKEEKVLIIKENFIFLILLLFGAIGIAGNNQINLYLSGKMLSATFFSFANGLPALLNIFAGTILFKEKLSLRLWIASAFAVIALICLCI
jgi:drug/metabolite transporter (DMT)-like permease